MAHQEQKDFFLGVKAQFPERFDNCRVLDVGSLDINGNNRHLFTNYTYTGVDVGPGPNVDVVSSGHEYQSEELYDIVISSECFEHDRHYPQTLNNCAKLTKPGGMFTFTCASTGRHEHGTLRTSPGDAPLLSGVDLEWANYYRNLTEADVRGVLDVDGIFETYYFEYNPRCFDLYFWGIKKA